MDSQDKQRHAARRQASILRRRKREELKAVKRDRDVADKVHHNLRRQPLTEW